MAEVLVSVVLDQLISILNEEVKLVVGVKEELKNLESNLRKIHGVVAIAEETQHKNEPVKLWLDDLKDVVYDMEDVLDEWNTALLKLQIEGRHSHDSASTTSDSWWRFSLASPSRFWSNRILLRRNIATQITELNGKLNILKEERTAFGFKVGKGKAEQPQPPSTSHFNPTKVQSRNKEKGMIKDLLLRESSPSSTMNIISIVGIGGIGKTTLARLLFDDVDVKAHFHHNIWVGVSKPFESIRIAREILESFTGDGQRFVGRQAIMTRIEEAVKGKKFLLVLDDVWEDGPGKWEELEHCLGGLQGSKVLVTTRTMDVANRMGCTNNNMFRLQKLSSNECWLILSQIAFVDEASAEFERLKSIGMDIVKKCDGLPLAAKALGMILRSKSSLQDWMDVLNSELWKLPEIWKDEMGLASLWLSYYDLPSQMRQCFSYCAIFPEDYTIEKSKLIAMWMAQGYLGTTSGEEHFQSLARRFFFEQFDGYPFQKYKMQEYKMHDVLRDFAKYLQKEECFSMDISNLEEQTELPDLPQKTRHLRIEFGKEASLPGSIFEYIKSKKLRTFWLQCHVKTILTSKRITGEDLSSLFAQLIFLRTLILSRCHIKEIPASIGNLRHLRQLDLSANIGLSKLHENVCQLHNLQTLDVHFCCGLKLPKKGMEKLINLRHLDNLGCDSAIPKGVMTLRNLRRLGEFVIDRRANEDMCSVADLKRFKNLEGHFVIKNLGYVRLGEVKEVHLNTMNQITDLWLEFGGTDEMEEMKSRHEQVIEALQPFTRVETLHIMGYIGTKFSPNLLVLLNNLKELRLECKNCEHLPPLWKLRKLEVLGLWEMKGVKRLGWGFVGRERGMNVGNEVSGSSSMVVPVAFPKLKILMFRSGDKWEEWESVGVYSKVAIMPRLTNLRLDGCGKLNALPNYIYQSRTLEEIILKECPIIERLCIEDQNRRRNSRTNRRCQINPRCIVRYL